jgi:hypothetical protein
MIGKGVISQPVADIGLPPGDYSGAPDVEIFADTEAFLRA